MSAPAAPAAAAGPAAGGFAALLGRLERELDLPYPERSHVLEEIAGDLQAAYDAARASGADDAAARARAIHELGLDAGAAAELSAVHTPALHRALRRLPAPAQGGFELVAAALPLVVTFLYLCKEVPLMQFLKDGGFGSILVLVIGAFGLGLLVQRAVVWFILRDHSPRGLGKNTSAPLLLAAATLCAAMLGTATNFYVVLRAWSEDHLPDAHMRIGLRESLSTMILGAALATLIVLGHTALTAALRRLRPATA